VFSLQFNIIVLFLFRSNNNKNNICKQPAKPVLRAVDLKCNNNKSRR